MDRLHKTMQYTYFCVYLSEAMNGRLSIIENPTIQTIYSVPKLYGKIIFIIILNETGLNGLVLPCSSVICRSPLIVVIKYSPSDFISTLD